MAASHGVCTIVYIQALLPKRKFLRSQGIDSPAYVTYSSRFLAPRECSKILALYTQLDCMERIRQRLNCKQVIPEAEFLDVTGTKVLRVFLLAIHSHLYKRILLRPISAKLFETDL